MSFRASGLFTHVHKLYSNFTEFVEARSCNGPIHFCLVSIFSNTTILGVCSHPSLALYLEAFCYFCVVRSCTALFPADSCDIAKVCNELHELGLDFVSMILDYNSSNMREDDFTILLNVQKHLEKYLHDIIQIFQNAIGKEGLLTSNGK